LVLVGFRMQAEAGISGEVAAWVAFRSTTQRGSRPAPSFANEIGCHEAGQSTVGRRVM